MNQPTRIHEWGSNMRSTLLAGLLAASTFAACSGGGSQAMLPGAVGGVQPAQSCRGYSECITLSYGAPFEQQWCIYRDAVSFNSLDCKNTPPGPWKWHVKVHRVSDHHLYAGIKASFDPNPGNPTALTIAETHKHKPSKGKIIFEAIFGACQGNGCVGSGVIGIAIGS
jgi:hypothetical protein